MKLLIIALLLSTAAHANNPPVKKSGSGRCYDVNYSTKYDKVKNFIPYRTLEDCIKSGGRKAKATFA